MDDLHRRLREAAAAHQPDRARILARLERGMTTSPAARSTGTRKARHRIRLGLSWPRLALAALATGAALAAGGLAVGAVVQNSEPRQEAAAGSESSAAGSSPSPSPRSPGSGQPGDTPSPSGTGRPSAPATTPQPGHTSAAPPGGTHTEDGPLWADGSVDPHSNSFWAQSNVTLRTRKPLTALTVELRIAQTGGVRNTGSWQTLPGDDFTISVREDNGVLVYRWTLKSGRTVPVGQHVFAGQYNHTAGGRDAHGDTYRADASTADTKPSVWGDFAPGT
ncbi:hypothetical protein GCM10010193_53000 [Kitasatospora atroaurantiaca]|uniref:Uncharacterized protein n=1 Tax=Kitasatospora atroaurantiaca TaxID=285545 RepID=A0A561EXJ6_9ACTN|nr:hypothetical protein FB465_5482 [Kitasatospora atroaurantiaca]